MRNLFGVKSPIEPALVAERPGEELPSRDIFKACNIKKKNKTHSVYDFIDVPVN